MANQLNRAAETNGEERIRAGDVNRSADWSLSSEEENAMLGANGDDWTNYARWHLGEDTAATEKTKARYKYPIGKGGRVYRAALTAIRQRAGQQGDTSIYDSAGRMVEMCDKQMSSSASAASPFEIVAAGAEDGSQDAEVRVYGDIGASWDSESTTAADFVRALADIKAKRINVRINSYGGSVSDALAIYNAMQRHPSTVNTFVDGVAVSAASLIAMAGKNVTMAANALMMVHGPMAMAIGNATDMRETADILDRFAKAMAPSYAAKTGRPVAAMLSLLTDGEDHWYTATEAHAAGFADHVSAPIAAQASFDLSRFRGGKPQAARAALPERSTTMSNTANAPAAGAGTAPQDTTVTVLAGAGSGSAAGNAERDRIKAIIGCEAAKTRPELAQHLAFETDMAPEAAASILAKAAPETGAAPTNALAAAMARVPNPNVGAGAGDDDKPKAPVAAKVFALRAEYAEKARAAAR